MYSTFKLVIRKLNAAMCLSGVGLLGMNAAFAQTVTAVMHSPLRILDPIMTTAHITRNHGYMIYDTLLATDKDNQIRPQMLSEWKVSEDGRTYTFVLRKGLKWHDGKPVTSEDCLASLQRWAKYDKMGQMLYANLEETKVIDGHSFSMTFKEASDLVLQALAKPSGVAPFMMPKRVIDEAGDAAIKENIGSGPYRMVMEQFKPGVQVVYEKNPDYVARNEPVSGLAGGKHVYVDRVKWVATPDSMTAVNALTNGEIDYLEQLPYDLIPLVKNNQSITIKVLDPAGYQTIMRMNHLQPPFDNPKIRLAAMYAVDQEQVLRAMIGNPEYYRTCPAIFGCGLPYESKAGAEVSVKGDIAKAKALLKEAGYDGTPIVVLQPTDAPSVNTQPVVIAQALKNAGFKVDLQAMDWQTLVSRRALQIEPSKGGWNIFATNNAMAEASDPLRAFAVAANGKQAWFGWPSNQEIESLRLQFSKEPDLEKRKALADKIQQLVIEDGVVLPMGQYFVPAAYSAKLDGVVEAPIPVFWNIKKH